MSRLALLAVLLAGAFGVFLWRGLPQAARLERAWADLRLREHGLQETQRTLDLVGYDEFVALTARHERAAQQLEQRRLALVESQPEAPPVALAELLAASTLAGLRAPSPQAEQLLAAASASPVAEATLVAILRALPEAEGLVLNDLVLRDAGRPHAVPQDIGLEEVEAQLVLTGALSDVVAALEHLAPDRGAGLPILSVRSASLRRIEPERWGGVHRLSSPPVRLTATLAVLFAAPRSAGS